jgi:acetyl esterase/lipase
MRKHSALLAGFLTLAITPPAALAQKAQERNAQPTLGDRIKSAVDAVTGNPTAKADTDMRHVIDALSALGAKSIEKLQPAEARQQPSASDAAMKVLRDQGLSTLPDPRVKTQNIALDGGAGRIAATVYSPVDSAPPLPIIVYYHGGGFVIANNSTYDASARMLSLDANAVVVAVEYSKAPEHKFPAAHDDAVAAYKWVLNNAASVGGDPAKVAVAGESAGGNLALNVAIAARDQSLQRPAHALIVYPMAGTDLNTQSYQEYAGAKPLNKPMMEWFYRHLTTGPQDMSDPRLDVVGKANLNGLPSITIITAQIDPLRSEGQALADKMAQAGVQLNARHFEGVAHEFFGMGLVVGKAKEAEAVAVADLKRAFAGSSNSGTTDASGK